MLPLAQAARKGKHTTKEDTKQVDVDGKNLSYKDARKRRFDVVLHSKFPGQKNAFQESLMSRRLTIGQVVAEHLGLRIRDVHVAGSGWLYGRYNLCIPIDVHNRPRVFFRVPLPYKLGQNHNPGNADEKLRCEIATYIWISEHCPGIPIAPLHGFGFENGCTFSRPAPVVPQPTQPPQENCYRRWWHRLWGQPSTPTEPEPQPRRFVRVNSPNELGTGYVIIGAVPGDKLADVWAHPTDDNHRKALFRSFARIVLSLNSKAQPRFGSYTINDAGQISLTNRPLTKHLHFMENEAVNTMPRNATYQEVEPYAYDLLKCHEAWLTAVPPAFNDRFEGERRLANVVAMRALLPQYLTNEHRHGPFVLSLTGLDRGDIFVDHHWNIVGLIDLEWACSLPVELQSPADWLSDIPRKFLPIENKDEAMERALFIFETHMEEFLRLFEEEAHAGHFDNQMVLDEQLQGPYPERSPDLKTNPNVKRKPWISILRQNWLSKRYWFTIGLTQPWNLNRVFKGHLQGRYRDADRQDSKWSDAFYPYFSIRSSQFIDEKLKKKENYDANLAQLYLETEPQHGRAYADGESSEDSDAGHNATAKASPSPSVRRMIRQSLYPESDQTSPHQKIKKPSGHLGPAAFDLPSSSTMPPGRRPKTPVDETVATFAEVSPSEITNLP
ncbi:hypothetical protein BDW69DRAFT_187382 [Aspergillus filifer]